MSNEEAKQKWTELIDWMFAQDGFIVIGLKDKLVDVQTNLDVETVCDITSLVFEKALEELGELPVVDKLH